MPNIQERYYDGLIQRIRQDRFPSQHLMDRAEAAMWTPEQVAEYVGVLVDKANESWYPSGQMLDRIERMLLVVAERALAS